MTLSSLIALALILVALPLHVQAEEDTNAGETTLMRGVATDTGRMSPTEQKLFRRSIQTTKESVARDTLDVFYKDALEYYHQGKYDEALELLDNIHSVDPYYEDVATLRETITRLKNTHDIDSKRNILDEYMRKGNAAYAAGQNVSAINFWKQALTVNASYEPAKKKIRQANKSMAQKQYEAGYLYYHKEDYDEAMNSWSNAIALDPSLKQRGLLTLMSKVQLLQRRDQVGTLRAKAAQSYTDHDLPMALQTYQELLAVDPRNEEARRMSSKIRIQLGAAAYKNGRESMSQKLYAQAIKQFQEAIRYGYERQKSERGIQDAERMVQSAQEEKRQTTRARAAAAAPDATPNAPATSAPVVATPPVATPEAAAEANMHYRESLAAIRSKDYHRAIQECEIASQLNPGDEHIYVACQRAKQEWAAANAGRAQ